jgi:hypothetical protein
MITLIDEEGAPTARELIGQLLQSATYAEIAVSHVRLGAIDLGDAETRNVQRCRVLLDRLDAGSLASLGVDAVPLITSSSDDASAAQRAADSASRLLRFITSDRVELRSAGVSSWRPDFSIYRGLQHVTEKRAACVVGAHYFGQPPALPAFTCLIDDEAAVELALHRFERLWERSHDVAHVVVATVSRLARATDAGG